MSQLAHTMTAPQGARSPAAHPSTKAHARVVVESHALDQVEATRLLRRSRAALERAPRVLVVDLARVRVLGAPAIVALGEIADAAPRRTRLCLVTAERAVLAALRLTCLHEVFDVVVSDANLLDAA